MRHGMVQLDEWISEIERQAGEASSHSQLEYFLQMQKAALQRFFVRIETSEDVACYRRHIDAYERMYVRGLEIKGDSL